MCLVYIRGPVPLTVCLEVISFLSGLMWYILSNLPHFIQFTSALEFEWKCMEFQYLQIVLFLYNLHSGKHLNGYSCNSSFPCTSVMDGYSKITSNFHESGVVSCGGYYYTYIKMSHSEHKQALRLKQTKSFSKIYF